MKAIYNIFIGSKKNSYEEILFHSRLVGTAGLLCY